MDATDEGLEERLHEENVSPKLTLSTTSISILISLYFNSREIADGGEGPNNIDDLHLEVC